MYVAEDYIQTSASRKDSIPSKWKQEHIMEGFNGRNHLDHRNRNSIRNTSDTISVGQCIQGVGITEPAFVEVTEEGLGN